METIAANSWATAQRRAPGGGTLTGWPRVWAALLLVVAIAIAAAVGVETFHQRTRAHDRAVVMLARAEALAQEEHALEYEVRAKPDEAPALLAEQQALRARMDEALTALAVVDDSAPVRRAVAALRDYQAALDQLFGYFAAGDMNEAEQWDQSQVDPSGAPLQAITAEADQALTAAAGRTERAAEVGIALVVLGAMLSLFLLFGLYARGQRAAARELAAQEARFRSLVEEAPAMISINAADETSSTLYMSPRIESILGYTPEEVVADPTLWIRHLHPDDRARVLAEIDRTNQTGDPFRMEYRKIARDGRVVWLRDESVLIRDDRGAPLYWQTFQVDITDRRRAEAALAEERDLLHLLMDSLPDLVFFKDTESRFIRLNRTGATSMGLRDPADAIGKMDADFIPAEMAAAFVAHDREVMASGEPIVDLVEPMVAADGTARWVATTKAPTFDAAGRVTGVVGIARDVTARRQANEWQRFLADVGGVLGSSLDVEATLAAVARLAVPSQADWAAVNVVLDDGTIRQVVCAQDDPAKIAWAREMQERYPPNLTADFGIGAVLRSGRSELHAEIDDAFVVAAGRDDDHLAMLRGLGLRSCMIVPLVARGRTLGALTFVLAESGRRYTEEDLARAEELAGRCALAVDNSRLYRNAVATEERYRTLVEQLPAVVYVDTPIEDGTDLVYISPQIESMLGYTPEDFVAEPGLWMQVLHPDDRERVIAEVARTEATGEPFSMEYRKLARDGRVVCVRDEAVRIRQDEDGRGYWQGVYVDNTARKEAEAARESSQERLRLALDAAKMGTWDWDLPTDTLTWSAETGRMSGKEARPATFAYADFLAAVHPADRERIDDAVRQSLATGEDYATEYRVVQPDGRTTWSMALGRAERDDKGRVVRLHGVAMDVTERKEAEEALRAAEERYRDLFDDAPVMYLVTRNNDGLPEIADCNDLFLQTLGYERAEVLGRPVAEFFTQTSRDLLPAGYARVLQGLTTEDERQLVTRDGRILEVLVRAKPERDGDGTIRGSRAAYTDVTAHKALEEQLAHQAFHDALTGLPNRALFEERLAHALARCQRQTTSVAVLFLDLDNFKVINDTLGHDAGDELLIGVGERLRASVRPGDTVARFGGDEFVVLLEDLANGDEATTVAERLTATLRPAFSLAGREVFVTASLGIAVGSGEARAEDFVRDADVALYVAKAKGRARYALFDPAMRAATWNRLELETDLRRGLGQGELVVFYQPLVDLRSGEISEIEALVRWRHPERGLVSPADFIPLAEETGLIVPLGQWALEEACRQTRTWQMSQPGRAGLAVSVNLSVRQFQHRGLVDDVARVLVESGLAPECLKLEITESAAMIDVEETVATLVALKELGVKLAIDDFGEGYAGLSYLRRCPVDAVKIDRSYVRGLGRDPGDEALVRAVVGFARSTGLEVTAEGIETAEQLAELRTLGCDRGQGYYFSRPISADDLTDLFGAAAPWQDALLREDASEWRLTAAGGVRT